MRAITWAPLIEGMLEAVWVVDAHTLRIVAVNQAACQLQGLNNTDMVGRAVVEMTAAPEDIFFWEDVAAGQSDQIQSETLLRRSDGQSVQVERRVSRVRVDEANQCYVVGILDHSEQRRVEGELEKLVAELRATLESTADGIMVCDLDGAIRGYNQHFAQLWEIPEPLLLERDDDAIHAHLASQVADSENYSQRLRQITRSPLLEGNDVLVLRSGRVLERVTLPQYGRGRPIGRVPRHHRTPGRREPVAARGQGVRVQPGRHPRHRPGLSHLGGQPLGWAVAGVRARQPQGQFIARPVFFAPRTRAQPADRSAAAGTRLLGG